MSWMDMALGLATVKSLVEQATGNVEAAHKQMAAPDLYSWKMSHAFDEDLHCQRSAMKNLFKGSAATFSDDLGAFPIDNEMADIVHLVLGDVESAMRAFRSRGMAVYGGLHTMFGSKRNLQRLDDTLFRSETFVATHSCDVAARQRTQRVLRLRLDGLHRDFEAAYEVSRRTIKEEHEQARAPTSANNSNKKKEDLLRQLENDRKKMNEYFEEAKRKIEEFRF